MSEILALEDVRASLRPGLTEAQVAEVSVNAQVQPRVERVVCAIDCGQVVNPDTVRAQLEGGVTSHVYLSWLHPEKTATVTVVGRDRMLGYEGRFEKRAITLFDYTIDPSMPPAMSPGAVPIVPITKFEGRKLDVPLGTEPLASAAAHFVECIHYGREPLTSGARSLRVVETLETADRTAVRSARLSVT